MPLTGTSLASVGTVGAANSGTTGTVGVGAGPRYGHGVQLHLVFSHTEAPEQAQENRQHRRDRDEPAQHRHHHGRPVDPVSTDLSRILRDLKLSGLKDTLPERLVLARHQQMGHAAFLELLLADELSRRDSRSATLRAARAGLDAAMRLETWDDATELSYDRMLLSDLSTLAFAEAGHSVLLLGPVGVGKTHLATALGHAGIRRRMSVHFTRADKLFTRLRAARLDNSLEAELRRIAAVDLLIIDDFAIKALDATETNDFYEIVVERHRRKSTIISSNREPAEWLGMTNDTLLAQSAIDRLTQGAVSGHEKLPIGGHGSAH